MNPSWTPDQQTLYMTFESAINDLVDFSGKKIPALGNKGTPQIVDMAGTQNELRKVAVKVEELLKDVVTSRLEGKTELRGDKYQMTVTGATTSRLNQGKAKETLETLQSLLLELRALWFDINLVKMQPVPSELEELLDKICKLPANISCMETTEGSRRVFTKLGPPTSV